MKLTISCGPVARIARPPPPLPVASDMDLSRFLNPIVQEPFMELWDADPSSPRERTLVSPWQQGQAAKATDSPVCSPSPLQCKFTSGLQEADADMSSEEEQQEWPKSSVDWDSLSTGWLYSDRDNTSPWLIQSKKRKLPVCHFEVLYSCMQADAAGSKRCKP